MIKAIKVMLPSDTCPAPSSNYQELHSAHCEIVKQSALHCQDYHLLAWLDAAMLLTGVQKRSPKMPYCDWTGPLRPELVGPTRKVSMLCCLLPIGGLF